MAVDVSTYNYAILKLSMPVRFEYQITNNCPGLHSRYENTRPRARRGDTVFSYSCAQSDAREAAPKLPRLGRKSRNRKRMERFSCNGWLFVAVAPGDPVVVVRIGHEVGHCKHKDFDAMDEEVQIEAEEDETAVLTA